MCGIAGIISTENLRALAERAKTIQAHRGPDFSLVSHRDVGPWHLHFTHNRLSVIDLQAVSNQPFWSEDQNYGIIFNGEIYNYLELKFQLQAEGVSFRTRSDTEVLMQALIHGKNLRQTLNSLNGMFAFAFLDVREQKIIFARDRFGKKPFYYHLTPQRLTFSSEIKYILQTAAQKFRVNPQPVAHYLEQFLLENDPEQTFFQDILKLPAGHFTELNLKSSSLKFTSESFYAIPTGKYSGSFQDAEKEIQDLLLDSVKLRLRSDVNVGFLLSGGLDSSALVGAGCKLSAGASQHLQYLSVVSENPQFDESRHIAEVEAFWKIHSEKINISHSVQNLFPLLEKAIYHNDEPLTSFSAVSYMLMMEKARALDSTVLLTGQGADEVFCGYKKYLGFYLKSLLRQKDYFTFFRIGSQFAWTRSLINEMPVSEIKRYLRKSGPSEKSILSENLQKIRQPRIGLGQMSLSERQALDLTSLSVPALLHYEDRLSMAHAREVRVPYLDYRLVELGLSLPDHFKIGPGWSKYILRQATRDFVPEAITWRKDKKGFTIPQEEWFRHEMKPAIEALFRSDAMMYKMGLVNPQKLQKKYELFCSGSVAAKAISFKEIFTPLCVEKWLQLNQDYLQS